MWNRHRSGLYTRQRDTFKLDYIGSYDLGASITSVDLFIRLGKPDLLREILIVYFAHNASQAARTLSSATLMGVPGDIQTGFTTGTPGISPGLTAGCVRFPAPQPAILAPLNMTFNAAIVTRAMIGVFRVCGRASYDTDASDQSNDIGTGTATVNATTIDPEGFLIGVEGHANANLSSVTGADLKDNLAITSQMSVVSSPPMASVSVTPSAVWTWTSNNGIAATWSFDF